MEELEIEGPARCAQTSGGTLTRADPDLTLSRRAAIFLSDSAVSVGPNGNQAGPELLVVEIMGQVSHEHQSGGSQCVKKYHSL